MEELLGRQAPHSAPAEQAVIGAMLIDPSCIPDVIEKVKSDEFYIQANRDIFDTIFAMFSYGQSVDAVTVLEQMKVRGVFKDTTQQYLMEVMQVTPTAANVLKYAAIVRDQALLRNLHTAADEINTMIFEGSGGADAMLEAAERKIYALRQGRNVGGLQPISMVIQRVYANLSEAASSGGGIPGLATGLPDLDQTILGLNAGELILIAARPGMGKTSLALNIALHVGKTSGKTVAVFSLEMAREQLTTRLLAGEGLVDSQKLLTGKLSADEWRRVGAAATTISATDIRIDDNPSLSVADMNAQCRRQMAARRKAAGQRRHICKTLTQYVHRLARLFQRKFAQRFSPIAGILQHSCRPTACVECTGNRFALTRRNPLVATARTNEHHAPNRFRRDIQRQNAARFKPQNLIGLHVLRPVSQSPK